MTPEKREEWANRPLTKEAYDVHDDLFIKSRYGTKTLDSISSVVEAHCQHFRSDSGAAQNIMNLLRGHGLIWAEHEITLLDGTPQDRGPWHIEPRTAQQKEMQHWVQTPPSDELLVIHDILFEESGHGTIPVLMLEVSLAHWCEELEVLSDYFDDSEAPLEGALKVIKHLQAHGLIEPAPLKSWVICPANPEQQELQYLELVTRPSSDAVYSLACPARD